MMAQTVPGQAQPASSPTSFSSWSGPGCMQQSLSSPSPAPARLREHGCSIPLLRLSAPAWPAFCAIFKSRDSALPGAGCGKRWGTGHKGCVFWRAAGAGAAVPTVLCLLEEWVSLPCLSAYGEMGTEEPALKTSLVVSKLLWRRTQHSLYCCLSGQFFLESECLSLQWLLMQRMWGGYLKAFKDLSSSQNM